MARYAYMAFIKLQKMLLKRLFSVTKNRISADVKVLRFGKEEDSVSVELIIYLRHEDDPYEIFTFEYHPYAPNPEVLNEARIKVEELLKLD